MERTEVEVSCQMLFNVTFRMSVEGNKTVDEIKKSASEAAERTAQYFIGNDRSVVGATLQRVTALKVGI